MADKYEELEASVVDYQSPAHVMLRREMKRQLINSIVAADDPLKGSPLEGGSLVIYGTTLIGLAKAHGIEFPIKGQKAGDIDIFIEPPANSKMAMHSNTFADAYRKVMGPLMKSIMKEHGFELAGHSGNGDLQYSKPFLCKKHFTADEIRAIRDKAVPKLNFPIQPEGEDVLMEVDLAAQLPISLLSPSQSDMLPKGKTSLRMSPWESLLAKKLARSMRPAERNGAGLYQHSRDPNGFKPRDLVDIYNITHARPQLVNLEDASQKDLLRTMLIVYFTRFGIKPDEFELKQFEPTPENIQAFKASMSKRVSHEYELTDDLVRDLLQNYHDIIRSLFPEKHQTQEKSGITLMPQEIEFMTTVKGYRHLSTGGTQMVAPAVKTTLLKDVHPQAFELAPELYERISKHPTLREIIDDINEKRSRVL